MDTPTEHLRTCNDDRRLQLLGVPDDVRPHLIDYLRRLNGANAANTERNNYTYGGTVDGAARTEVYVVDSDATGGGKFLRIVSHGVHRGDDGQAVLDAGYGRSVHAFVEKATGKVVKPAGWAAPAKSTARGRRGELLSRFTLSEADSRAKLWVALGEPGSSHGGYLYGA